MPFEIGNDFLNLYDYYTGAKVDILLKNHGAHSPLTLDQQRDIMRIYIEMRDFLEMCEVGDTYWGEATAQTIDRLTTDSIDDSD